MNPKIRRSAQSVEDVYEIATYLLKDGLSIAERFLDAVETTFQTLGRTPLIGVPHAGSRPSQTDLRRWRVRGFENFMIFYRPLSNGIEIIRVLHGARDIERLFE